MDTFELEIIKPEICETIEVEWVDVQTPTGDFFIGSDHIDLISVLKERGQFIYKEKGKKEKVIDVYGGFLKISNGKVKIILEL